MWDNLVDACGRGDADDEAAPVLTPREARAPSDPEAGSFDRRLSFSEDALRKSDDQADPGRARTPSANAHGGEPPARGAPQEAARAPRREARRRDALREDGAPAHAEEPRGDGRPARGRPRRQQVPRAAAAQSTARALPKPRPPEPAGGHHGGLPLQVPAQGLPRAPAPRHGAHRQEVAELPLGPLAEDQVVPRRVRLRELQGNAYPPDVSPKHTSPA